MHARAAFTGVIIIWSTTPLAIKWSAEAYGFSFAVTARMIIGTLLLGVISAALRRPLPHDAQAVRTYLAAAVGIYGAMMMVYWGSLYISSGLISVLFGLSPMVTGVLAALLLREQSLTPVRLLGIGISFGGLLVVFGQSLQVEGLAMGGVVLVCLSVVLHSLSSVLVKKNQLQLPVLSVTTGGMLVALPLYLLTWVVVDGQWPDEFPGRGSLAIVYLGVCGSVIGFLMYYHALKHMQASQVALLALITPVTALWLGYTFNNEPVTVSIWLGTCLILTGMVFYQWGRRLLNHLFRHWR